jgi:4a-hydroxytetrahydrobiopterin dehydratase
MAKKKNESLTQKHCVPCEGGTQPLPQREAQAYHKEIPEWTLHHKSLERELKFKDFKEAMSFINKVADVAEEEGHHPDIYVFYSRVRLQLSTHAIGGLSVNDFILAAKIDRLLNA